MPDDNVITPGGIMPQFTPLDEAGLAELSTLVSNLFTGKATIHDVKPTLIERALLEIRAWRRWNP